MSGAATSSYTLTSNTAWVTSPPSPSPLAVDRVAPGQVAVADVEILERSSQVRGHFGALTSLTRGGGGHAR